ncbi:MAG: tetratricopeptide repeat protein [Croceitalea sp.]|nr:tetratricopeptide repeat protein [Croceitalea sp.]
MSLNHTQNKLFSNFGKQTVYSCFLFLLCVFSLNAQNISKDSLKAVLEKIDRQNDSNKKDSLYIEMMLQLASEYRFYKSDSLLSLSKEGLKLSKKQKYTLGESKALNNIGDFYSDKGQSKEAISYYKQSFSLADSIGNIDMKIGVLNDLSSEYGYSGNYAQALKGYLEGIDLANTANNKLYLSILNENIANLYASQKEFDQALEFYSKVRKINEELKNDVYEAETLSNLASVHTDMKDFDNAMFHINKSISIFEKHEIYDWLAFAYGVKGEIYLGQKKFQWALYWFDQSNILHHNLEDERGQIDLLNGMAKAYLGLEEDSISAVYALQAYDVSKKIKSLEGQLECAKTLYTINKNKADYEQALSYHEMYQQMADSLSRDENKKSLTLLKTKLNYDQQKADLIASNEKSLAKQRNYINVSLIILFILAGTTIPLYLNQKKQKKLYKELKTKTKNLRDREGELNEINKTKDRLFSIIGHDLRGPIGALQGLLRLFTNGELDKEDFLGFVPKLKTDVDHILFTLNNLLSWGHAQMNGTKTRPKIISLHQLVDNNIHLLSELAATKSIKIINQLPENPMAFIDENQIDIVIRNLISNGIKFTPNNGLITIEAEDEKHFWRVKIKDTGIGMDEKTQAKLFNDNSNITTYGTNNEKGTGLGLSLCKEMVLKNNGKIWVESKAKKGSSFYFTVPKVVKKYAKAG